MKRTLLLRLFCVCCFFISSPQVIARSTPISLSSVSPRALVDTVQLICHETIDLSLYSVTDLDGTDSYLSESKLICETDDLIEVQWNGDEYNREDKPQADIRYRIFLPDTAFTNTKDQVAIVDDVGEVIDGMVFWDGESTFVSSSESKDIDVLIDLELWPSLDEQDAVVIQEDEFYQRIAYEGRSSDWELFEIKEENTDTEEIVEYQYSSLLHIHSLLPNPEGSDAEGEYIILYNTDEQDLDIKGWKVSDETSSYVFLESEKIVSGGFYTLTRIDSNIALNNFNETIRLFDPDEIEIDSFSYESSEEGKVIEVYVEERIDGDEEDGVDGIEKVDKVSDIKTVKTSSGSSMPTSGPARIVYSPQTTFIVQKEEKKRFKKRFYPWIKAVQPKSSKNDSVLFYNPNRIGVNLSDYIFLIDNIEITLPDIVLYPFESFYFPVDLPNIATTIHFGDDMEHQTITYHSVLTDQWYKLDVSTATYSWEKKLQNEESSKQAIDIISKQKEVKEYEDVQIKPLISEKVEKPIASEKVEKDIQPYVDIRTKQFNTIQSPKESTKVIPWGLIGGLVVCSFLSIISWKYVLPILPFYD